MLRRQRHHGKAAINPLIRHILVEQVAMRVPEYPARPGPAQRLHERLFIEPHFAAPNRPGLAVHRQAGARGMMAPPRSDRKSVVEGKSVSVRVDLGGRRIINKKKSYDI